MAIPVFGLQAIKDKAIRDAIYQIAQRANAGAGGAQVEVQEEDPDNNTPGEEGNIIYATGTDSIWVFTATTWERAIGGNGIYIQVDAVNVENNDDYGGWTISSSVLRNNTGSVALRATIIENGEARNDIEHEGYTYQWSKNGTNLSSVAATQNSFTGVQERALIISASDVTDQGSDAFTCTIDY